MSLHGTTLTKSSTGRRVESRQTDATDHLIRNPADQAAEKKIIVMLRDYYAGKTASPSWLVPKRSLIIQHSLVHGVCRLRNKATAGSGAFFCREARPKAHYTRYFRHHGYTIASAYLYAPALDMLVG